MEAGQERCRFSPTNQATGTTGPPKVRHPLSRKPSLFVNRTMVVSRRKKSASTTKSNTPTTSPRRTESKETLEKLSHDNHGTDDAERKISGKDAPEDPNPRPYRLANTLARPLLRSKIRGLTKSSVPKINSKKAHKPSPLSLKDAVDAEDSKEGRSTDKLDSPKELGAVSEQPADQSAASGRRWSVSSEILLLKCLADNKPSGIGPS